MRWKASAAAKRKRNASVGAKIYQIVKRYKSLAGSCKYFSYNEVIASVLNGRSLFHRYIEMASFSPDEALAK